ncbi:MAG: hypothetical protein HUU21_39940 [Polyangiaceae bacterium]|nr:hypothetical protein [Polyangiaceae bacterium]
MQGELDAENLAVPIEILGVNEANVGTADFFVAGKTLPWLQDTPAVNVWGLWGVTFRDVVVLDGQGKAIAVYNVTVHPLSDPANYAELKAVLQTAASQ